MHLLLAAMPVENPPLYALKPRADLPKALHKAMPIYRPDLNALADFVEDQDPIKRLERELRLQDIKKYLVDLPAPLHVVLLEKAADAIGNVA